MKYCSICGHETNDSSPMCPNPECGSLLFQETKPQKINIKKSKPIKYYLLGLIVFLSIFFLIYNIGKKTINKNDFESLADYVEKSVVGFSKPNSTDFNRLISNNVYYEGVLMEKDGKFTITPMKNVPNLYVVSVFFNDTNKEIMSLDYIKYLNNRYKNQFEHFENIDNINKYTISKNNTKMNNMGIIAININSPEKYEDFLVVEIFFMLWEFHDNEYYNVDFINNEDFPNNFILYNLVEGYMVAFLQLGLDGFLSKSNYGDFDYNGNTLKSKKFPFDMSYTTGSDGTRLISTIFMNKNIAKNVLDTVNEKYTSIFLNNYSREENNAVLTMYSDIADSTEETWGRNTDELMKARVKSITIVSVDHDSYTKIVISIIQNIGQITSSNITQNDIYGTWLQYEECLTINGDNSVSDILPSHTTITSDKYILHTRGISPLEITPDYLIIGDKGNTKRYRYKLLSKDILVIQKYDFADNLYMKYKREDKVINEIGELYRQKYITPLLMETLNKYR